MVINDKLNLTMLCYFYELTMSQGYFATGYSDRIAYFDLFFRQCPDGGGFAIAAGLEQIIQYVMDLHFGPEDIDTAMQGRQTAQLLFEQIAQKTPLRQVLVAPRLIVRASSVRE